MKDKTINILFIIFLCLFLLVAIRVVLITWDNLSYSEFCNLEYGENWTFENTAVFGYTCVEVDYLTLKVIDRKKLTLSSAEINKKYCDSPTFFDFDSFVGKCVNSEVEE